MKISLSIFILTLCFVISGCQVGSYKNQSTLEVSAKEEPSVNDQELFEPKEDTVEAGYVIGDELFITMNGARINDLYKFKGNLVRQGKFEEKVKVIERQKISTSLGGVTYWYQVEMADGKIGWAHENWVGDRDEVEEARLQYDKLRRIEEERIEREPVIIRENDGREKPVIRIQNKPEITGIIVVAQGAESVEIKYEIYKAISSLLGLPKYKISVLALERR